MRKVICINNERLPEGASLTKDAEYLIEKEFINNFGQKVYLIHGINNEGHTSKGLHWYGYSAHRFASPEESRTKVKEYEFALN